ncbi:MAG: DUF5666 domain-containing protein [Pseudomonadota bacterium]
MNRNTLLTIGGCFAIVACGGGGGEATAGIDGRGTPSRVATVSRGTITGFGSVIVNGVRYDTSNASFDIDGVAGAESDLAVGQVVTIQGSTDENGQDARADSVSFDALLEGPVESIDVSAQSFVVLGQTVIVNNDTIFDDDFVPQDIEGLAPNDVVEISGFFDANDNIRATYVDLEQNAGDFEVSGIVSNLDAGNLSFEINGLTVDFSNANLSGFPNGAPENGQQVEAEGTLGGGGELLATSVELEDNDLGAAAGDDAEVEGIITRFVSAADFDVNGVPVTTNASTSFDDGSSTDLALNVAIEVEGEVNASGVIVAESIDFEQVGTLELRGIVEAVGTSSITLLGITATVAAETSLDDQSSADLASFALSNVSVGDYVEVRGFDDSGTLTLTGLERDDDEGDSGLQGPITAISNPDFTALGVTVRTTVDTEFEDANENEIDAATFFAGALNEVVEVDGSFASGVLTAEEVEVEDD